MCGEYTQRLLSVRCVRYYMVNIQRWSEMILTYMIGGRNKVNVLIILISLKLHIYQRTPDSIRQPEDARFN